jgi:hypothetical protein
MSAFDLSRLTPAQREITQSALDRCDFPFELIVPNLREQTGQDAVPVEWTDLSRYARAASAEGFHTHVYDSEGNRGHLLAARRRALGLAWYSGKVSIERSLVDNPELAQEVFLSEAAHMVDFFWMTEAQRDTILAIYHDEHGEHGHTWFDSPSYWDDAGESFMAGFVMGFSDLTPSIGDFSHKTTPARAAAIRALLLPEPEPEPVPVYLKTRYGRVYHREGCWRLCLFKTTPITDTARLRPCKSCRPNGG